MLSDPDPLVRRAALLALSEMPASEKAGAAIHGFLLDVENFKDRWLPLAATCAAARHDLGFLKAAWKTKTNSEVARATARIVAEHFARGSPDAKLMDLLGQLPSHRADTSVILEGLAAGWPSKAKLSLDSKDVASLKRLMSILGDDASELHLATLAGKWGLTKEFQRVLASLQKRLLVAVADNRLSEQARLEAARKVMQTQPDQKTLERLTAELTIQASPTFAAGILDAVSATNSPALGEVLVARWRQLTPKLQQKALTILLQRPEWSKNLLIALEKNLIAVGDLSADQGQLLANHPDAMIAKQAKAILARGGALPSPDRQKVLDSMLHLTEKTGNVAKGLEVFKKNCVKCHRHGQIGENIGPNLTGFAVHPKAKLLTEIIDPNRSVEGNYREYRVVTTSGRIFNGLLASETKTAIELVDNEAKKHTILREDIERLISSAKSIMPEGFEKQITAAEFVDLLEFLSARGKYLPLPLEKAASIVSTKGMFYSAASTQERLIFPDWGPKTVQGVPFQFIDPKEGRVKNVVLLYGPQGKFPPTMPKSVTIPCNTSAKAIHFLSGVSGWGFPYSKKGTVSMIVRLYYQDGKKEDHPLINGEHFADYIRRVDVPGSRFAFLLEGAQQIRYLAIHPRREQTIREIELVKGPDATAPIVMAVTVEGR